MTTRWGRIGTNGQSKVERAGVDGPERARKLVEAKIAKGYRRARGAEPARKNGVRRSPKRPARSAATPTPSKPPTFVDAVLKMMEDEAGALRRALGRKRRYRGPLVIVASSSPNRAYADEYPEYMEPRSALVAIVDLVDVRPGRRSDRGAALCDPTGEFSWVLANARRLVPTRYTRSRIAGDAHGDVSSRRLGRQRAEDRKRRLGRAYSSPSSAAPRRTGEDRPRRRRAIARGPGRVLRAFRLLCPFARLDVRVTGSGPAAPATFLAAAMGLMHPSGMSTAAAANVDERAAFERWVASLTEKRRRHLGEHIEVARAGAPWIREFLLHLDQTVAASGATHIPPASMLAEWDPSTDGELLSEKDSAAILRWLETGEGPCPRLDESHD
jgi:hypothetical protein